MSPITIYSFYKKKENVLPDGFLPAFTESKSNMFNSTPRHII